MKKDYEDKAHQAYILKLETELHELEQRESSATRRMQLLVYPATVAFIILSAYGFYLVSSLTKDVEHMADFIATMHHSVNTNMQIISGNTIKMSSNMSKLIESTKSMNHQVVKLSVQTQKMSKNVEQMSVYTGHMQQDLWSLNRNISKPFNFFNTFMPWRNDTTRPRFINTPFYAMPAYYQPQQLLTQQVVPQPTLSTVAVSSVTEQ